MRQFVALKNVFWGLVTTDFLFYIFQKIAVSTPLRQLSDTQTLSVGAPFGPSFGPFGGKVHTGIIIIPNCSIVGRVVLLLHIGPNRVSDDETGGL